MASVLSKPNFFIAKFFNKRFMNKFNVPMVVVGGGGYTIANVAKCWTYETSVLLGETLDN